MKSEPVERRQSDADLRAAVRSLRMIVPLLATVLVIVVVGAGVVAVVTWNTSHDALDAGRKATRAANTARVNSVTIRQFIAESRARRDENCRIQEYEQAREVEDLRRTYEFLPKLIARDPDSVLVAASIQALPSLEEKARVDNAPGYCDEPGAAAEKRGAPPVGLPEPDPVIPKRPRSLRHLR